MLFQSDADKFQHFLESGNCHLGEFGPTNYGRSIKSGPPEYSKGTVSEGQSTIQGWLGFFCTWYDGGTNRMS